MRLGLALRAFWKSLTDARAAEQVASALDAATPALTAAESARPAASEAAPAPTPPARSAAPGQNPAVTLLATLQREARLIDLIHENLDQYADAQVGAAARPCLKQCRQTLDRMLHIERLVAAAENETVSLEPDASPGRYRWLGESGGEATAAKLVHPGWQATTLNLPQWSGPAEEANILAPAQIQSQR